MNTKAQAIIQKYFSYIAWKYRKIYNLWYLHIMRGNPGKNVFFFFSILYSFMASILWKLYHNLNGSLTASDFYQITSPAPPLPNICYYLKIQFLFLPFKNLYRNFWWNDLPAAKVNFILFYFFFFSECGKW